MQRLFAIQELCAGLDRGDLTRSDFADEAAASVAALVGCSAAAFWLLLDTHGGRMVQPLGERVDALRWGLDHDASAARFAESLETEGCVIAHDARLHAATAPFFDPTLPSSPVRSMLAVPFSINGDLFGAFVCAELDRTTRWSAAQLSTLRRITVGISPPLARATSFTMSVRPPERHGSPWVRRPAGPNRS